VCVQTSLLRVDRPLLCVNTRVSPYINLLANNSVGEILKRDVSTHNRDLFTRKRDVLPHKRDIFKKFSKETYQLTIETNSHARESFYHTKETY